MKYATKLMVVPYVPTIEDPQRKQITDLDAHISEILNNKSINIEGKIKAYQRALVIYNEEHKTNYEIIFFINSDRFHFLYI